MWLQLTLHEECMAQVLGGILDKPLSERGTEPTTVLTMSGLG